MGWISLVDFVQIGRTTALIIMIIIIISTSKYVDCTVPCQLGCGNSEFLLLSDWFIRADDDSCSDGVNIGTNQKARHSEFHIRVLKESTI